MPNRVYALDATPMVARPTGIGRFVRELAAELAPRLADDEHLVLHAGVARLNPVFGVSQRALLDAARARRTRLVRQWSPLSLAHAAWRRGWAPPIERWTGRLDVYHGTNYLVPRLRAAAGVVTVHDLSPLTHPEGLPPELPRRFRAALDDALTRCRTVVTDSVATRDALVDVLGFSGAHVIPLGVSARFRPATEGDGDRDRVAPLTGGRPFLLFVGTSNPRKNLARALDAFARARQGGGLEHALVLAGDAGHAAAQVDARVARPDLAGHVLRPGYVHDDVLPALYRTADGLLFPSLDEGFGLPVVEAQACGCPVLAGDRGALPEVSGGGALLVDPTDVDALADAMVRLVRDTELRRRLVAAGAERARSHTWGACAEAYLALYRHVAAG